MSRSITISWIQLSVLLIVVVSKTLFGAITITLSGSTGSLDGTISLSGSGAWTTSSGTTDAFTVNTFRVANSSDASLGGQSREGFLDQSVDGTPMNAALTSGFNNGQYVPLDSAIGMTADAGEPSFAVIGLWLDFDSPSTHRFGLITDQPRGPNVWSAGTTLSYTLNSSSTFSLDSTIGATFDQAFNEGSYTLENNSLSGTLVIAPVPEPSWYPLSAAALSVGGLLIARRNRLARG